MTNNEEKKEELSKEEVKNEAKKAKEEKHEAVDAKIDAKKENAEVKNDQPKKANAVQDGIDIFDENEEINLKEEKSDNSPDTEAEGKKKAEKSDKKGKKGKKKKKKKKEIKRTSNGRAYIQATYNNTIVALTDQNGNTLAVGSSGQLGFKGPKKSTPFAASVVVRDVVNKVREYGLQYVSVYVKGVGSGRESAVRALNANGLNILSIKDVTPVPHNGCRKKKPRRV